MNGKMDELVNCILAGEVVEVGRKDEWVNG